MENEDSHECRSPVGVLYAWKQPEGMHRLWGRAVQVGLMCLGSCPEGFMDFGSQYGFRVGV